MNNRNIVIVLVLLVAVSAGAYLLVYNTKERGDLLSNDSEFSPSEIPGRGSGIQTGLNDSLGLNNIIVRLMTGLSELSENDGTVVDIIELVDELKVELNTTVAGIDLDEAQLGTVEQIKAQLDLVREFAEKGSSVEDILEQIRPQRRPN